MNKYEYTKITPFKWFILENFPLIDEDFDALTNWQLFCKLGKEINKIIKSQNDVGTQMENVTNAFIALENYVNNYFENLDVQEEIDNKLDDMAESGQLTEIIAQYLQLAGILAYDTLNDMKNATNLANGSIAKTLGYYTVNDGGGAYYKIRTITNNDVVDEMFIIALDDEDLIAELIYDDLDLKQIGAKGDDTQDDTNYFKTALEKCDTVYLSNGTYKISENCLIDNKVNIIGDNLATLHFTDGTENICPNTNGRINMTNVKINSDAGIGYHINRTGIKNTKIENCEITASKYPVLVNLNTDDGENITINNNIIETPSDGIEINTTSDNENKFKNVFITNNKITVVGGSGTEQGFGIGVADGKNVVISNNIIDGCRLEGIHIEDTSKKIVVTDNVVTNCLNDGMKIYTVSANKERHVIQNNYISGNNKTHIGINLIYAPTGQSSNYNIGNNIVENFDVGVSLYDSIVDGLQIINCNKAFGDDSGTYLKGNVTLINTPKFGDFSQYNSLTIDSITTPDVINPTTFITCSNSQKLITIKNLEYTLEKTVTQANDTDIDLLTCPSYLDVILEVSLKPYTANYGKSIVHVTYNTTDGLEYTVLTDFNNGVFANLGRVILDDGMLKLHPYNPNQTSGVETVFVKMNGLIVNKGTYNYQP